MTENTHFFSPQEANELLPTLIPLVEAMLSAREQLLALQPELQETLEKAINNGNSQVSGHALAAMTRLKESLARIVDLGVEVKDVNRGLLDFPSIYRGQVVYLCWSIGEERVGYWHPLDGGFAARRPLEDEP